MPTNQSALPVADEQQAAMPLALEQWLTVDEVAAWLKVNKHWVYEHTRSRAVLPAERLPYIKIGKYLRFNPAAIREYLGRHAHGR